MKIVLFGAPGSGKGTQAVVLSEHYRLKKISLGDILRDEVKKASALGNEVKSYMEKGLLVPDELVSRVIEENISDSDFILDGYPRNVNQAKVLDGIFQKKNITSYTFLYLDVDEQAITERLSQRLVCGNCGANYHVKNMPPKQQGMCDMCGKALVQRKDDNPEVIKKRWQVFSAEAEKILEFYKNKNVLVKVDGKGNKDDVFARVKKVLK